MTKNQVKKTIDQDFAAIRHAVANSFEASQYIYDAFKAALKSEKMHRSSCEGYQQSTTTAAKYFVIKWFREPAKIDGPLSACQVRHEALLASAAGIHVKLFNAPKYPDLSASAEVDYVEHIAPIR